MAHCLPETKIVFYKTHKTGSSTIQNIMLRYGRNRKLNFALPAIANQVFPDGEHPFDEVARPEGKKSDIYCFHTIPYDEEIIRSVMKETPKWVTVIRQPKELFVSFYKYFDLENELQLSMSDFVNLYRTRQDFLPKNMSLYGPNQMLRDFSFPSQKMNDTSAVEEFVKGYLDRLFDLVMVVEFMDESLILLRDLLCWDLEDIVYLPINRRMKGGEEDEDLALLEQIKEINRGDEILYSYFREKLLAKIEDYGKERMAEEVRKLTESREAWLKACQFQSRPWYDLPEEYRPYGDSWGYSMGENLPDTYRSKCESLILPELQFIEVIRAEQRLRNGQRGEIW
ncbi:unnamed protein product [Darwinula stevensoni]|uniref:Sulfotransferase n=1 Tax=Darwinula stevensoni TaxID=69355 RepID=A0A7R9ABN2_9CRUS|nr:unnamed protein product [Darwinula stevensoni]CAG0899597.1 unnamed protein product [Darwinula stevensoni]